VVFTISINYKDKDNTIIFEIQKNNDRIK